MDVMRMDMEQLRARFAKKREEWTPKSKGGQTRLARALKTRGHAISPQAISKFEKKTAKSIPGWLTDAAEEIGTSLEFLKTGAEPTIKKGARPPQTGDIHFPSNDYGLIPMYGAIPASQLEDIHLTDDYRRGEQKRHDAVIGVRDAFAVIIRSRQHSYKSGFKLFINPDLAPRFEDDCIIEQDIGGAIIIAEFKGETDVLWNFLQLNPNKEISLEKKNVYKVWVISGVTQREG